MTVVSRLMRRLLAWLVCPALAAAAARGGEQPMPPVTAEAPAPGKLVKVTAPEYAGTGVHHCLYLPADWQQGKPCPVIVEYAGNQYGSVCSGKVEDCRLGYFQSGGQGFIWMIMPFVNSQEKSNQLYGWGDIQATVAYCRTNLRRACLDYGGDTSAVFITGFSRGAMACGYVGLHDEEIADAWLGFLPHSHHDGGSYTIGEQAKGGLERLARIRGRASLLSWGGAGDGGKANSLAGKAVLDKLRFPAEALEIPKVGHDDRWIMRDSPERRKVRQWLSAVVANKPGTRAAGGTVRDQAGRGVPGVMVSSGPLHWALTDAKGEYRLAGLVPGARSLAASQQGREFAPAEIKIALGAQDLSGQDFVMAK